MPEKLSLANVPTPLWRSASLDALCGTEVWVKRDDMSAGAESGNKVRKLEYLLSAAVNECADTVITCGAAQSNHARATALLGATIGIKSILFLRTPNPASPPPSSGNLLLDRMAGAEVRFITPSDYAKRTEIMEAARLKLAKAGQKAYVIPEGGSNGLGALGYVDAMREVREQLDSGFAGGPGAFDAVVHACGSGGTAAGVALGASLWNVAEAVIAVAVCDDRAYFDGVIGRIVAEARALDATLSPPVMLVVDDRFKGPGYGVASDEQIRFIAEVARASGLVLDPVYSGKALFGLAHLEPKPRRALFIHTGGLPGLLAQPEAFTRALDWK
jgi:D-cysteine desulfhydrase